MGACKALCLILAAASTAWSVTTLPLFSSVMSAREMSDRIIVNDRFGLKALHSALDRLEPEGSASKFNPDLARAVALVGLRISEEIAGRASAEQLDRDAAISDRGLRSSLGLNPADSFLWLALYSAEMRRNGFSLEKLPLLDQSYATAPLEAWIALRRNRLALATFPFLSQDTQEKVISEFAGLVDSGVTDDAAANFMGPGWEQRDRLLARLADVNLIAREAFAKRLARDGVKVIVPGVDIDERLWR